MATLPASSGVIYLRDVAKMIDHSILKPDVSTAEARASIEVAKAEGVATVCVRPCDVALAANILKDTDVMVCTVIGFPHGTTTTESKVAEATEALKNGAVELDMVLNISWLKSGRYEDVQRDIEAVVAVAKAGGAIVKVILENAYLTNEEKVKACQLVEAAGGAFVKTSTGYAPTGSTADDLVLMRKAVSPMVRVKAAGGLRTLDAVMEARACGASRCGATATTAILDEFRKRDPEGKGLPEPTRTATSAIGGGY